MPEEERKRNPVLLVNGHSTESYYLPTEPNDLIRTLLEEGHETWLLQTRLDPLNPSNNFTIEDIGRFDIPAGKKGNSSLFQIVYNLIKYFCKFFALIFSFFWQLLVRSLSYTGCLRRYI